jgi:GT2 family glycosyltransferase
MTTPTVTPRDRAPVVAVIVVNFRTPSLTIECVESVVASRGVAPRVLVIDNASGDDSLARFASRWLDDPAVTVHALAANGGYAGGNNAGFRLAEALGARYALALNSDAIVDPDCLRVLVDEAERDPRIALASPRIFAGDDQELLWFGGGRFSLWTGRPIHVGWRRPPAHGWHAPRDMPYASGCALLVRLAALRRGSGKSEGSGGGFDASLFSYAEDLDLSLRLRRAGYRIRFVPDARVWHFDGASHRRAGGQSLRFYLSTRNLLRVVARHARWYHWPVLAPMLAVDVVGRLSAVAIRDRDLRALGSVLRGAWHAVVGGRHPIETANPPRPEATARTGR